MLMIGEAALAVALGTAICKQRENGKTEVIPMACIGLKAAVPNSRIVLQASGMGEFIAADFSSVNGVQSVRVTDKRDRFTVEVVLSSFDKDVRRKVYAKQKAFYREFPTFDFDFYVVDASLENALA